MIGCTDGAPLTAPSLNEADYGTMKTICSVITQVDGVLFQNVKDCVSTQRPSRLTSVIQDSM